MSRAGTIRKLLIGIPSEESVFRRPGFATEAWPKFQPVAHSLVAGYHATLENSALPVLVPRLEAVAPELRGFAYEGAGMALAALDVVAPWRRRLKEFVDGPGAAHIYPIYVGVGLALARLKRRPEHHLADLDPVLGWVIVDGYGFHEGFFATRRHLQGRAVPTRLSPYARRVFDQGLGRALWFSGGAVVDRIVATIDAFPPDRQAELWSGIGLASAYGGGTDRAGLDSLRASAGPYRPQLARGAATAARGRAQAGNPAEHTELACAVFCGLTARDAVAVLDRAQQDLPLDGPVPAYEVWRRRAHALFAAPRAPAAAAG